MPRSLFFGLALTNLSGLPTAMGYYKPPDPPFYGGRRLASIDFENVHSASSGDHTDGSDWVNIQERCEDVKYELHMFVDSHIFVVAFPTTSSRDSLKSANKCPVLAFEDGGTLGSTVSVYHGSNADSLKSHTFDFETEVKLSDIVIAFVNAESTSGNNYSIVKNNCATFLLSMSYRGLVPGQPTPDFVEYVTDSLVANDIGEKILESSDVDELGATDAVKSSASALTRTLVETYIANFFREI